LFLQFKEKKPENTFLAKTKEENTKRKIPFVPARRQKSSGRDSPLGENATSPMTLP
jgi:hypothetical protein